MLTAKFPGSMYATEAITAGPANGSSERRLKRRPVSASWPARMARPVIVGWLARSVMWRPNEKDGRTPAYPARGRVALRRGRRAAGRGDEVRDGRSRPARSPLRLSGEEFLVLREIGEDA